jgi:transcriptional antiterminator RfaH
MHWIVARCELQRTHVARMYLMRENLETYVPRIKQHGRIIDMFGAYLFVRAGDQWYGIRWTVGVQQILMSGEKPARLSDDVVAAIRGREVNGIVTLPRAPRLKPGQKVRVVRGSFQDKIGVYDHMVGRDREAILLHLLGQQVRVVLPGRDVAALT